LSADRFLPETNNKDGEIKTNVLVMAAIQALLHERDHAPSSLQIRLLATFDEQLKALCYRIATDDERTGCNYLFGAWCTSVSTEGLK